jgi:curved DNA-binding protein CbpA
VLGLEPGATAEAIKRAHRRLVKLHHPDMGGSAEAFRRVNEAYQQLVN